MWYVLQYRREDEFENDEGVYNWFMNWLLAADCSLATDDWSLIKSN